VLLLQGVGCPCCYCSGGDGMVLSLFLQWNGVVVDVAVQHVLVVVIAAWGCVVLLFLHGMGCHFDCCCFRMVSCYCMGYVVVFVVVAAGWGIIVIVWGGFCCCCCSRVGVVFLWL